MADIRQQVYDAAVQGYSHQLSAIDAWDAKASHVIGFGAATFGLLALAPKGGQPVLSMIGSGLFIVALVIAIIAWGLGAKASTVGPPTKWQEWLDASEGIGSSVKDIERVAFTGIMASLNAGYEGMQAAGAAKRCLVRVAAAMIVTALLLHAVNTYLP
jgi:hypothetical protein